MFRVEFMLRNYMWIFLDHNYLTNKEALVTIDTTLDSLSTKSKINDKKIVASDPTNFSTTSGVDFSSNVSPLRGFSAIFLGYFCHAVYGYTCGDRSFRSQTTVSKNSAKFDLS